MDAPENDDLAQKVSGSLLAELTRLLPRLLYKTEDENGDVSSRTFRNTVPDRAPAMLIRLLDSFQEWPQLLDPKLEHLLSSLAGAYLQCSIEPTSVEMFSSSRLPLSRGISKVLYAFCKVRGVKVVSRFLDNEPRYLEPMLETFEQRVELASSDPSIRVAWEENYVSMLWLSHLVLTPFDLSTTSSGQQLAPDILPSQLIIDSDCPPIAVRLASLAIRFLSSPSKVREPAILLLTRLSLRPDMRKLSLHQAIITWALASLDDALKFRDASAYQIVGILSLLAGMIKSADGDTLRPFLLHIFHQINSIRSSQDARSTTLLSSALSRKAMAKLYSAIAVVAIQQDEASGSYETSLAEYVLEDAVDLLLSMLGDNDTPVRYSASKALSVITAKLDPFMAADVAEAVVESMNEKVLWNSLKDPSGASSTSKYRDLTAVSPLRWHGLTLALSHFLFRRSIPLPELPSVLGAVILALNFEQRSPSGASLGSNVRDAACFGIWALSRRYSTTELLEIDTSSVEVPLDTEKSMSILQVLALELVVCGTTDPSGNIRRGSSAALQELIGRHPDAVLHGIALVQVVDYQAIALRSRAMKDVAFRAAELDRLYGDAILSSLMGWRGIVATDPESRRWAATSIGALMSARGVQEVCSTAEALHAKLCGPDGHDVEKRHGLLLTTVALVDSLRAMAPDPSNDRASVIISAFWNLLSNNNLVSETDFVSITLRPDLTKEAFCSCLASLASANRIAYPGAKPPQGEQLQSILKLLNLSFPRAGDEAIGKAKLAARSLFDLLDDDEKERLVEHWIDAALKTARLQKIGNLYALGSIYPLDICEPQTKSRVLSTILYSIESTTDVDIRIAALKSLKEGVLSFGEFNISIANALKTSLGDYTTDQRGDIGSLVRLEAIDAVRVAWRSTRMTDSIEAREVIGTVCILAVEKLDKVRFNAWQCLVDARTMFSRGSTSEQLEMKYLTDMGETSSKAYFSRALRLFDIEWTREPLFRGLVTSVGGGSESISSSSRAAISAFLADANDDERLLFCQNFDTLLQKSILDERVVVPILETLVFVLQTNLLNDADKQSLCTRRTFNLVQKAHFKSSNVRKLLAAIAVYEELAGTLRDPVIQKLSNMLLHPFPVVRQAAGDAIFVLTQNSPITKIDLTRPPKEIKSELSDLPLTLAAA